MINTATGTAAQRSIFLRNSLAAIAALSLFGWVGNHISLSMAFGIDFIFGSVAALLAVYILGPLRGTVVAVIASSYTFLLWGHPYAWLIFSLEILTVGALLQLRWINSLVVADTIYWLLIGIPLVWLTYGQILGVAQDQVWLIALKQPLNGITNAILASLILLVLPINWINRQLHSQLDTRVGIRDLTFTILITAVYLSSMLIIVQQSRNNLHYFESEVEHELQDHAEEISLYLSKINQQPNIDRLVQIFSPEGGMDEHGIIIIGDDGSVLKNTCSQEVMDYVLAKTKGEQVKEQLHIWHPDQNSMPLMAWWNHSIYYLEKGINERGIRSVILTQPTKHVIAKIQKQNIAIYLLLIMVIIGGVIIALVVSNVFNRTILQLVKVTSDVPNKLRQGYEIEWPRSRILEFDILSSHSSDMSQSIRQTLNGYQSSQELLTERVRHHSNALEENYARLSAIIAGSADGIITIDDKGLIESFNTAAEEIFGYSANEVIGRNVNLLMPEPYKSSHDKYLSEYKSGTKQRVLGVRREVEGQRKNGELFPMELSVSQITLKDRRIYTGFVHDISERKEGERIKNEFISTVSHELRTPLTAIRGAIGLLSGTEAVALSEKSRNLLSITLNNTERLVRLINDILDIQKLEAGSMNFVLTEEDLIPIINLVWEQNASYVEQFNVTLRLEVVDESIRIRTNIDRLNQVLTNLISNAAKFSPPHGVVTMRVLKDGKRVRIEVQDQGSGIPEEFQGRIFQKFSQADGSSTRRQGGTGLGLSISKGFVEQMNGEINFHTTQGVGTTFFVSFPILEK